MRQMYMSARRLNSIWCCIAIIASAGAQQLFADSVTVTQTLSATINPIGKVSVPAAATLSSAGVTFNVYTASLAVRYRVRTATGGTITLRVTSDFAPGGPSAAAGDLVYTCIAATLGSPCSGAITASTSGSTPVLTLPAAACTGGGAPCSTTDPNLIQVNFTLKNNPTTATGSYAATIQFTISAT